MQPDRVVLRFVEHYKLPRGECAHYLGYIRISLIVLERVIETHSTRNVLLFRKYELRSHTPHE